MTGFSCKQPKTRYPKVLASVGAALKQYPEEGDEGEGEVAFWPVTPPRKNDG